MNLRDTKPIGSKVLVEMLPERLMSDGGIHLLESPLRSSVDARVIALGPHAKLDCNPGDQVFLDRACLALDIEEGKLRMIPAEGVLAILTPC